jgi:hypothetical protein
MSSSTLGRRGHPCRAHVAVLLAWGVLRRDFGQMKGRLVSLIQWKGEGNGEVGEEMTR